MCGITGALDPQADIGRAIVEKLNAAQQARGPDHSVVVDEGPFILGNTRLAIQDPTPEGNQPFRDPAGRFTVVFNGEIYNFHEIVRSERLRVETGCDGEIIPLLWERYGPDCLALFRGMYAIAVADHQERCLFLARDPFGIKPLRFRSYRGGYVFASEVRALWELDRSLPVAPAAIADFLQWGAVGTDRCVFDGIETVEAGACLRFDLGGEPRTELRQVPIQPGRDRTLTGTRSLLADALRETVRLHLVADVPTALLLSAGVDSTLMALAARELGHPLHCLTVTGPTGEDESLQAEATAAEYGHTHETVPAVLDEKLLGDFFGAMQQPTVDGLNTFLVSRAVQAAGFKVALSGLGGDEALGGYSYVSLLHALPVLRGADVMPDRFKQRIAGWLPGDRVSSVSGKATRLLERGGPRTPSGIVELQRELYPADRVASLLGTAPEPTPRLADDAGYDAMARTEVARYMGPMLLNDADGFSMACSIELRVPFVDVDFFAAALHRRRLRGKRELVGQMGDRYLRLLSRRRKTGFSVPMGEWLASGVLHDVTSDARRADAPVWQLVDEAVGRPILDARTSRWSEPWALAALDAWLRSL